MGHSVIPAEAGIQCFRSDGPALRDRINTHVKKAMASGSVRQTFAKLGMSRARRLCLHRGSDRPDTRRLPRSRA